MILTPPVKIIYVILFTSFKSQLSFLLQPCFFFPSPSPSFLPSTFFYSGGCLLRVLWNSTFVQGRGRKQESGGRGEKLQCSGMVSLTLFAGNKSVAPKRCQRTQQLEHCSPALTHQLWLFFTRARGFPFLGFFQKWLTDDSR